MQMVRWDYYIARILKNESIQLPNWLTPFLIVKKIIYIRPDYICKMDVFTYSFDCQRWYGSVQGVRNIYVEGDVPPEKAAKKDAEFVSGSKTCDIQLLQRFRMLVSDVETFPAMAAQPLHRYSSIGSAD
jgi:hypothetical protein